MTEFVHLTGEATPLRMTEPVGKKVEFLHLAGEPVPAGLTDHRKCGRVAPKPNPATKS